MPGHEPPRIAADAGIEAMLSDAFLGHINGDDGGPWAWHTCDGPMVDGSNPCAECRSISRTAIAAARFLGLDSDAADLERQLVAWEKFDR